jgi:hypothetical protein
VTVFAALVLPTAIDPRLSELAESVSCPVPVPLNETVCVPALSTILKAPDADPAAVGENVTEIVQVAAGITFVHVFVCANGAGAVRLVNCRGPVPAFVTVIVLAAVVAPCTTDPKFTDAGLIETAGAVPVPESATVCTPPAFPESSLIVKVPPIVPLAVGANVTVTAQLDPAGRAAGQLLAAPKPALAVIVPMSRLRPPKLVTVTAAVPVVPRFCEMLTDPGFKLIADGRGLGSDTGTAPYTLT